MQRAAISKIRQQPLHLSRRQEERGKGNIKCTTQPAGPSLGIFRVQRGQNRLIRGGPVDFSCISLKAELPFVQWGKVIQYRQNILRPAVGNIT